MQDEGLWGWPPLAATHNELATAISASSLPLSIDDQNGFAVRWSGLLRVPCPSSCTVASPGEYTLRFDTLHDDDRVKLWLDNRLVIDQWTSLDLSQPQATIAIVADDAIWTILAEYRHSLNASQASTSLLWGPTGGAIAAIASDRLYVPMHLLGSPLNASVRASTPAGAHTTAAGTGLSLTTAGTTASFTVTLRDTYGNLATAQEGMAAVHRAGDISWAVASPDSASHLITTSGSYSASLSLYSTGGVWATYYSDADLTGNLALTASTSSSGIDLCPSGPCTAAPSESGVTSGALFSARFSGAVRSTLSGAHAVTVTVGDAADRLKMWVDNNIVVEQWSSLASLSPSFNINLPVAEGFYDYNVEYKHATPGASFNCRLIWSDPTPATVATSRLFLKDATAVSGTLSVLQKGTCAGSSTIAGAGLTLATSGISAPVVIVARDQYGNEQASGGGDQFMVRMGETGLSGSSTPSVTGGTHTAAYLPKEAGHNQVHVSYLRPGGLSSSYYDGPVVGDGLPSMTVENEGPVLVSGGGHPIPGRRAESQFSARWQGMIRAGERLGSGLQATYYDGDANLTPSTAVASIGIGSAGIVDFSSKTPSSPLLSGTAWSTRWGGFLRMPSTGNYTFSVSSLSAEERVKLWIDNVLLVEQWLSLDGASPTAVKADIVGGAYLPIKLEVGHDGASSAASVSLLASGSAGGDLAVVSRELLFTADYTGEVLNHSLWIYGAGEARAWFNNTLAAQAWGTPLDQFNATSPYFALTAGALYDIKIEYRGTGKGVLSLGWTTDPGVGIQAHPPTSRLFASPGTQDTLPGSPISSLVFPGEPSAGRSTFSASPLSAIAGEHLTARSVIRDEASNEVSTGSGTSAFVVTVIRHGVPPFWSVYSRQLSSPLPRNRNFLVPFASNARHTGPISTTTSGTHIITAHLAVSGGLSATYYSSEALSNSGSPNTATAASASTGGALDFSLDAAATHFPAGDAMVDFGAIWEGMVRAPSAGDYTFGVPLTSSEERVKLWVDGLLLVDQWSSLDTLTPSPSPAPVVSFQSDGFAEVAVKYWSGGNGTLAPRGLSLQWTHSGSSSTAIPSSNLFRSPRLAPTNGTAIQISPAAPAPLYTLSRGYGMSTSRVGSTAVFTIAAKDAYGNEPADGSDIIRVKGLSTGDHATSRDNLGGGGVFQSSVTWNGTAYIASYTPPHTGGFSVSATVDGSAALSSPWVMVSYPARNISAARSVLRGSGLTLATAGQVSSFTVSARDQNGGGLWENVGRIGAFLGGSTVSSCSLGWTSATGTYALSYTPTEAGDQFMRVCSWEGEGLVGEYFGDDTMEVVLLSRIDSAVNFNWARGVPGVNSISGDKIQPDNFAVRWTGYVSSSLPQVHSRHLPLPIQHLCLTPLTSTPPFMPCSHQIFSPRPLKIVPRGKLYD